MLSVTQFDNLDPSCDAGRAWERLVAANPASGMMQTLAWATFKRRLGFRTLHLALYDGATLVGGLLGYLGPARPGPALLVAPEGPVLPWDDPVLARAGLRALVEAVEALAPAHGLIGLRVEPRLTPPAPRLLRGFGRAPVDFLPTETLCLDLTGGPTAVRRQLRPKGRYNIGLSVRHGVTVRAASGPDAQTVLVRLLAEAGERGDFFVEPAGVFTALVEALAPTGQARILIAERDAEPLAAMLLVTCGRRATYLYGAVANRQRTTMAGYALQWAAIEAACAAGCSEYDLFGYEPHGAPEHLYAGFSRFKRQFGGVPARFIGAHDVFLLDRLADAVVAVAGAGAASEGAWT
ncbi:MAG: peptidoglycan bridge formation glycyltransferase FemA/FemB family protein [Chloroflexi bacterium]|nr:peptidoglycan bridge formation glycyltransferase FemA/FemB family protein [Chloroflexota bacterium]